MRILFFFLLLISSFSLKPQSLPAIEITEKWLDGIENMVEGRKRLAPNKKKDILIFSLHTGYNHWTIPHTEAVIKRIAEKTGDFNVNVSYDVKVFEKKNILFPNVFNLIVVLISQIWQVCKHSSLW